MTEPELHTWVDNWMTLQPLDGSHRRLAGLVVALSAFSLAEINRNMLTALATSAPLVYPWMLVVLPTGGAGRALFAAWTGGKLTSCAGTVKVCFP